MEPQNKNNLNQNSVIILACLVFVTIGFSIWIYIQNIELEKSLEKQQKHTNELQAKSNKLARKIKQFEETRIIQKQKTKKKTKQLISQKNQIEKLKSENVEVVTQYKRQLSSSTNYKNSQRKLMEDLHQAQKDLMQSKSQFSMQRSTLETAKIELTQREKLISQQVDELGTQRESIKLLESTLSNTTKELDDQKWTNETVLNQLFLKESKLDKMESERAQDKQKINEKTSTINQLETDINNSEHQQMLLKSKLAVAENKLQQNSQSFKQVVKTKQQLDEELQSTQQLLVSSNSELNDKESSLKNVQTTLSKTKKTATQRAKELQERQYDIKLLQAKLQYTGTKITDLENRFTIFALKSDILFNQGKAELKPLGRSALSEIAEIFRLYPERKISIQGHTDDRAIGNRLKKLYPSNWELAAARAGSAIQFLQNNEGIKPERMSLVSYSQYQPVQSNNSEQGKANNRRIEIILMPKDFAFFRESAELP